MTAITSAHMRQLETARENLLRQQEIDRQRNETLLAKQIQQQTGCTWSDAITSVINRTAD